MRLRKWELKELSTKALIINILQICKTCKNWQIDLFRNSSRTRVQCYLKRWIIEKLMKHFLFSSDSTKQNSQTWLNSTFRLSQIHPRNFFSFFRNGLSTEDCYQVGKYLNTAHVYSFAVEWLTEAIKRYDEYYDQHQVKAVDILEELAKSLIGNNQIAEAEKVVKKVLRMNGKSEVARFFKASDNLMEKRMEMEREKLCHSDQYLRSSIFTCPIWCFM